MRAPRRIPIPGIDATAPAVDVVVVFAPLAPVPGNSRVGPTVGRGPLSAPSSAVPEASPEGEVAPTEVPGAGRLDPQRVALEQAAEYRRLSAEQLLRAREGLAALRYRYPDEDWDAILGSLASVGNYHLEMNGCLSEALRHLYEREE